MNADSQVTTGNLLKQFRRDSQPLIIDQRSAGQIWTHDAYGQRFDTLALACACDSLEVRYQQAKSSTRFVYSLCAEHGLQRLGTLKPATRQTDELRAQHKAVRRTEVRHG